MLVDGCIVSIASPAGACEGRSNCPYCLNCLFLFPNPNLNPNLNLNPNPNPNPIPVPVPIPNFVTLIT